MVRNYFKVNYEMDRQEVALAIERHVREEITGYICVADGVVLNIANRNPHYLEAINGSIFSICDSSYVPLYLKWIYGTDYQQYCGAEIFRDVVCSRKYRMAFVGTSQETLERLRAGIREWNPEVDDMLFYELPFRDVEDFDYAEIAGRIEESGAEVIWVALGAPKQELFMARLKPYLRRGVMIAVGAVFKFYSGVDEKRAPGWMVRWHMEWVYRIMGSPKKQLRRCGMILYTLPRMLRDEYRRKRATK